MSKFFRPKFILIRIGPRTYGESDVSTNVNALSEDVRDAVRLLRRNGFMSSEENENGNLCDKNNDLKKRTENNEENNNHQEEIDKNIKDENSKMKTVGNIAKNDRKSNKYKNKKYVCVWGTRLNEFEFSGNKWGKW